MWPGPKLTGPACLPAADDWNRSGKINSMRQERVRRHFLLAALYARAKGVLAPEYGVTAIGLGWDIGYSSATSDELRNLVNYMAEKQLIEAGPTPDGQPGMRLTAEGVDALEAFSDDIGIDVVELVDQGRMRFLVETRALAEEKVGMAVDPTEAADNAAIKPDKLPEVLRYLHREGLAIVEEQDEQALSVSITPKGAEVSQGDLSSASAPRTSGANVQIHNSVVGPQFMVGGQGASQHQNGNNATSDHDQLAERMQTVLEHLDALGLPPKEHEDVQDDGKKLLEETRQEKPDSKRIQGLWKRLADILSPVLTGGATGVATDAVKAFLAWS